MSLPWDKPADYFLIISWFRTFPPTSSSPRIPHLPTASRAWNGIQSDFTPELLNQNEGTEQIRVQSILQTSRISRQKYEGKTNPSWMLIIQRIHLGGTIIVGRTDTRDRTMHKIIKRIQTTKNAYMARGAPSAREKARISALVHWAFPLYTVLYKYKINKFTSSSSTDIPSCTGELQSSSSLTTNFLFYP